MAFDPNDPETKKALKEAVEAAIEDATSGLVEKNRELLGKLKKAQKDATIDPADHAALQTELETTQAKLKEAEKVAKTATTEAEKHKKSYEGESKVVHDLLVDNGLSTALLENGIKNPVYLKAAKALLASQVILTAEGDKRIAKVGDKSLTDFIKTWAGSDEGKSFVAAAVNNGGGASGGHSGDNNTGDLSKLSPEARLNAINTSEGAKA
jgi:hypothetical protein